MSYVRHISSRSCSPVGAPSSSVREVDSSVYHSFIDSEISVYHNRRGIVCKRPTEKAAVVILGAGCIAGIKVGGFGGEFLKSCPVIGSTVGMLRPSAAVLKAYHEAGAGFRLVMLPLPPDFTASVPCPYLFEVKRQGERIDTLPSHDGSGYRRLRICRYLLKTCRGYLMPDYGFHVNVIFEGI